MKCGLTSPCNDCPFRRKARPGWVGSDTPEGLMESTMNDRDMPCHVSVDYTDPEWRDGNHEACAGAAIFFANICKRSRDPERGELPDDRDNVFTWPDEFVAYHGGLEALLLYRNVDSLEQLIEQHRLPVATLEKVEAILADKKLARIRMPRHRAVQVFTWPDDVCQGDDHCNCGCNALT